MNWNCPSKKKKMEVECLYKYERDGQKPAVSSEDCFGSTRLGRPLVCCMPPLWYLLSFPDPAPPCTEAAAFAAAAVASYSTTSSSSRVVSAAASTVTMDTIKQQWYVCLHLMIEIAFLQSFRGDERIP